MRERGLDADYSTVFRWLRRYAPEINKRVRQHLKMSGPRSGCEQRHHIAGTALQKALKRAIRAVGVVKPGSCHAFRHCFATHMMESVRPDSSRLIRLHYFLCSGA